MSPCHHYELPMEYSSKAGWRLEVVPPERLHELLHDIQDDEVAPFGTNGLQSHGKSTLLRETYRKARGRQAKEH